MLSYSLNFPFQDGLGPARGMAQVGSLGAKPPGGGQMYQDEDDDDDEEGSTETEDEDDEGSGGAIEG